MRRCILKARDARMHGCICTQVWFRGKPVPIDCKSICDHHNPTIPSFFALSEPKRLSTFTAHLQGKDLQFILAAEFCATYQRLWAHPHSPSSLERQVCMPARTLEETCWQMKLFLSDMLHKGLAFCCVCLLIFWIFVCVFGLERFSFQFPCFSIGFPSFSQFDPCFAFIFPIFSLCCLHCPNFLLVFRVFPLVFLVFPLVLLVFPLVFLDFPLVFLVFPLVFLHVLTFSLFSMGFLHTICSIQAGKSVFRSPRVL